MYLSTGIDYLRTFRILSAN